MNTLKRSTQHFEPSLRQNFTSPKKRQFIKKTSPRQQRKSLLSRDEKFENEILESIFLGEVTLFGEMTH